MKTDVIKNIVFCLFYYILTIALYSLFFVADIIVGIIVFFSKPLFWIIMLTSIIFLLLPLLIKRYSNVSFVKSLVISLIGLILFFALIIISTLCMLKKMETFTPEKWQKYPNFHYMMEEDLEKKYKLIGMKKNEIIELLGEQIEYDNMMCYYDSYIATKEKYYCLEYDENETIKKIDIYSSDIIKK